MKCLFEMISGQEYGPIHRRFIVFENGQPTGIRPPDGGVVLVAPDRFTYREPQTEDEWCEARRQAIPDGLENVLHQDAAAYTVAMLWVTGRIESVEAMLIKMAQVLYETKSQAIAAFARSWATEVSTLKVPAR